MLVEAFCRQGTSEKAGKEIVTLSYTYLMAWFAMHFPFLFKPGEEPSEDAQFALLCFENSRWSQNYVAEIRKMVRPHVNTASFTVSPISLAQSMVKISEMKGPINRRLGRNFQMIGQHLTILFIVLLQHHMLLGSLYAQQVCSTIRI